MDQFPGEGGDVSRRSRLAAVIGGRSSRGNYGLLVDSKGDSKRRFNESFSKRSVGDARALSVLLGRKKHYSICSNRCNNGVTGSIMTVLEWLGMLEDGIIHKDFDERKISVILRNVSIRLQPPFFFLLRTKKKKKRSWSTTAIASV